MRIAVLASVRDVGAARGNQGDLFGYVLAESRWFQDLCRAQFGTGCEIVRVGVCSPDDCSGLVTVCFVGSIVDSAMRCVRPARSLVFCGVGCISDSMPRIDTTAKRKLAVVGVRGKSTARLLRDALGGAGAPVVGDPALLLPLVIDEILAGSDGSAAPHGEAGDERAGPVGFVVHSVDRAVMAEKCKFAMDNLVNNYDTLGAFLRQLRRRECIVTTSLHGMIFAHALGIKAVAISVGDRITGGDFKYDDYCSVYDRFDTEAEHAHLRKRVHIDPAALPQNSSEWEAFARAHAWVPHERTLEAVRRDIVCAIRDALAVATRGRGPE